MTLSPTVVMIKEAFQLFVSELVEAAEEALE